MVIDMSDEELEHMKQTVHELCGVVLRLQVDLNGKPDLRDQFAMAALTGIAVISQEGNWESKPNIAEWCYQMADAMMEARE
jgi:hypothetical protein